jgi:hypothetical protein
MVLSIAAYEAQRVTEDLTNLRTDTRTLLDAIRSNDVEALQTARHLASGFNGRLQQLTDPADRCRNVLASIPIDASGLDLSHIQLGRLGAIEGIIWTAETKWPPKEAALIYESSREIRPGVYQVGRGYERDPSKLARG